MAIKENDKNANNSNAAIGDAFQQAHARTTQGTEGPAPQSRSRAGMGGSIMNINNQLRPGFSRNSTSEQVIALRDNLYTQMTKNFDQGIEETFKLLVLDKNKGNVGPMSSVLVCAEEQYSGVNHIAVYTLIIEGSGDKLNARPVNIGGRNVEVDVVAGDVFNDVLWGKISDYVKSTFGGNVRTIDAGVMVIPSEMELDDENHIRRVAYNTVVACNTILESYIPTQTPAFNIKGNIDKNTDQMTVRLDYNPGQNQSAVGEPIRSDVSITLQGSVAAQATQNEFEQSVTLTQVDAFVDLVYMQPEQQQPGQMPSLQHYVPRMVITRADSAIDAITMEIMLMGLAQTTILSRNMGWAGVFRPRHHVKKFDAKDIGAIGYEVNFTGDASTAPEKIDTKAKDFDDNALYQFMTTTIRDTLIVSMDIEEVGELSWINQAFIAAANGNKEAYDMIVDAANVLTDGQFKQVFDGTAICYNDNNRIHLGYYIDENGVHRDLRDIDYLAILNYAGKDDPTLIAKWSETFDNTDIPMEIRLEDRANILRAVLSQNLHIKGYAQRITFNPVFLQSLNIACANAGLVVRPSNVIQDFSGIGTRGNTDMAKYGINSSAVGGMYSYGNQGSQYGQYQAGAAFQGRFTRNH